MQLLANTVGMEFILVICKRKSGFTSQEKHGVSIWNTVSPFETLYLHLKQGISNWNTVSPFETLYLHLKHGISISNTVSPFQTRYLHFKHGISTW